MSASLARRKQDATVIRLKFPVLLTINSRKSLCIQREMCRTHEDKCISQAICTMASFYYYYQNPSGFRFLVQIRAFVTQTSLGIPNFKKYKRKRRNEFLSQIDFISCKWPICKMLALQCWEKDGKMIIWNLRTYPVVRS